jgi:hypothetical protein
MPLPEIPRRGIWFDRQEMGEEQPARIHEARNWMNGWAASADSLPQLPAELEVRLPSPVSPWLEVLHAAARASLALHFAFFEQTRECLRTAQGDFGEQRHTKRMTTFRPADSCNCTGSSSSVSVVAGALAGPAAALRSLPVPPLQPVLGCPPASSFAQAHSVASRARRGSDAWFVGGSLAPFWHLAAHTTVPARRGCTVMHVPPNWIAVASASLGERQTTEGNL